MSENSNFFETESVEFVLNNTKPALIGVGITGVVPNKLGEIKVICDITRDNDQSWKNFLITADEKAPTGGPSSLFAFTEEIAAIEELVSAIVQMAMAQKAEQILRPIDLKNSKAIEGYFSRAQQMSYNIEDKDITSEPVEGLRWTVERSFGGVQILSKMKNDDGSLETVGSIVAHFDTLRLIEDWHQFKDTIAKIEHNHRQAYEQHIESNKIAQTSEVEAPESHEADIESYTPTPGL